MVTKEEWKVQRNTLFEHMPLVSVVVPLYETPECFLRELIEGMLGQSYENWELCLADGSPTDKSNVFLQKIIKRMQEYVTADCWKWWDFREYQ